jgi:hypothetical protein
MEATWAGMLGAVLVVVFVLVLAAAYVAVRVGLHRRAATTHKPEVGETWTIDDQPIVIRKATDNEIQWSYVEGANKLLTNTDTAQQWLDRIANRYVRFTGKRVTRV